MMSDFVVLVRRLAQGCVAAVVLLCGPITACSGGFFTVSSTADLSTTPHRDRENAKELYLTGRPYFYNEGKVREHPDAEDGFSHIYVFANYTQPGLVGAKSIPLYLIDLKTGGLDTSTGMRLFDLVRQEPDKREEPFIELEVRALEKAKSDAALAVWDSTRSALDAIARVVPVAGVATALDTADTLSKQLKQFSPQETKRVAKFSLTQDNDTSYAEAWIVRPLASDGREYPAIEKSVRRVIDECSLGETKSGRTQILCAGTPLTTLPYIVIETSVTDYVTVPELLPQRVSPTCTELSPDTVGQAYASLKAAGLTPRQHLGERVLLDAATMFLAMGESSREGQHARMIDQYDRLRGVHLGEPSSPYSKAKFGDRLSTIQECGKDLVLALPGGKFVAEVFADLAESFKYPELKTAAEFEAALKRLRVSAIENDSALAYLRKTVLYAKMTSQYRVLSHILLDRHYRSISDGLRVASANEKGQSLRENALGVVVQTSCETCKAELNQAVAQYDKRLAENRLAQREREMAQLRDEQRAALEQANVRIASIDLQLRTLNQENAALKTDLQKERQRVSGLALAVAKSDLEAGTKGALRELRAAIGGGLPAEQPTAVNLSRTRSP